MMLTADYIKQAMRTKSDQLHTELVTLKEAQAILGIVEVMSVGVDIFKKALFYGKALPPESVTRQKGELIKLALENIDPPPVDVLHALLGMTTETSELSAAVRSGNTVKIIDELGDMFWYVAMLCDHYSLDPAAVMAGNIAKLTARFPDKFSSEAAINKDERLEKSAIELALAVE